MAIGTAAAIAIGGSALIGGGASLLAGETQADAAGDAASLQAQAAQAAAAEQRRQYETAREDLAPYRETGATALAEYGALYGVGREGLLSPEDMEEARGRFKETPGYQFRFDEGLRSLDRSASARGTLRGGGYGRELMRYGQGVASGEFENYANRLAGIAGMGQGATTSTATLGAETGRGIANTLTTGAANQGNAIIQAGTARASGYAGAANALTGAAGNFLFAQQAGL